MIHTWKEVKLFRLLSLQRYKKKLIRLIHLSRLAAYLEKLKAFTADEWKKFILIYSTFALKNIVDTPHYNCWCLLVRICELLCQPILSRVEQAHILFIEFCKHFESLYGTEYCTPNMHYVTAFKRMFILFRPSTSIRTD